MAKRKSRGQEQPRELTRKEHRMRARDRERNRRLMIGVGIALGLAALVVVIGLVNEFVIKPNGSVATVGATKIVTRDFWKRVHLEQNQLQNQLIQYDQLERQFGGQGFFASQINQIQATLASPFTLGAEVLDRMIQEEVIRQEATARGITVTETEVDEALRQEVASGEGAVTAPQATATAEANAGATATAASWTPTPEPTVDVSATVTITATPLPTPEPPPTPSILTDEQYQAGLTTLADNLDNIAGMSLAEYRQIVAARLLRERLSEAIAAEQVAATEEQVNARHILLRIIEPTPEPTPLPDGVPTPEPTLTATPLPEGFPTPEPTPAPRDDAATLALAQELRTRLEAGEDFATLAQEYSDDPGSAATGGELGWFGRGRMVAPFEEAAFSLEPGEISQPVKSDFGYHLIEVLEKDAERPKDEAALQQERQQAFQTWIEEQVAAANVERPANLLAKLPSDLEPFVLQQAPAAPAAPLLPDASDPTQEEAPAEQAPGEEAPAEEAPTQ
jgi:hypothetical protein